MRIPRRVPSIVIIGQAVLSVALAIGIIILALSNGSIARTNSGLIATNTVLIQSIHTSNVTSCTADNQDRAESRLIIQSILDLPAIATPQFITAKLATQQAAQIKAIETATANVYAPRNCAALYPDPKG